MLDNSKSSENEDGHTYAFMVFSLKGLVSAYERLSRVTAQRTFEWEEWGGPDITRFVPANQLYFQGNKMVWGCRLVVGTPYPSFFSKGKGKGYGSGWRWQPDIGGSYDVPNEYLSILDFNPYPIAFAASDVPDGSKFAEGLDEDEEEEEETEMVMVRETITEPWIYEHPSFKNGVLETRLPFRTFTSTTRYEFKRVWIHGESIVLIQKDRVRGVTY